MKKQIKVTAQDGVTMVWYLGNNGAVVANVEKKPAGWAVTFRDNKTTCLRSKADAVAIAKRWVKATM